jgi:hypothetical protein
MCMRSWRSLLRMQVQPSPFDKLRAGSAGLSLEMKLPQMLLWRVGALSPGVPGGCTRSVEP